MKYRYVGDIHGQINLVHKALDCDADRIIFVGDFLDSWTKPSSDQIECIKVVLEQIETGRVAATWGNHEWSYIDTQQRCSGWHQETQHRFAEYREAVRKKFKPFVYEQGVLVTHAGLTKQLWDDQLLDLEIFQQVLTEWSYDTRSPYFQVGQARGGPHPYGGPLWCDIREFQHIEELPQVFGHSRGKTFRELGNAICIDVNENGSPAFLDVDFGDVE